MRGRNWIAAAAGTSLALTAALVATGSLTTANADGITVTPIPTPTTGTISLYTNWDSSGLGKVDYSGSSTHAEGTTTLQPTSTSNCAMQTSGTQIVSFTGVTNPSATTPTPAQVGFATTTAAGAMGVVSSGTSCSQVNLGKTAAATEGLIIDISSANILRNSDNTAVSNLVATSAKFDIESKGSVVVRADFYKGSSTTILATRYLYTGSATVPAGDTTSVQCSKTGKDTGPDSGSGDNCDWAVNPGVAFTKVKLTPTAGASFAVEGGGDYGTANGANLAHLTQFFVSTDSLGTLACNQSAPSVTGADGTQIGIKRVTDGNGNCDTLIPYNASATADTCQFVKPLDLVPTAQFIITCVRIIDGTSTTVNDFSAGSLFVSAPTPSLYIEWPDGNPSADPVVPNTAVKLNYCPADLYSATTTATTSNGVTTTTTTETWNYTSWLDAHKAPKYDTSTDPATLLSYGTDMSPMTGLQYSCIYRETAQILDPGQTIPAGPSTLNGDVQVTDIVYLTGDAVYRGP